MFRYCEYLQQRVATVDGNSTDSNGADQLSLIVDFDTKRKKEEIGLSKEMRKARGIIGSKPPKPQTIKKYIKNQLQLKYPSGELSKGVLLKTSKISLIYEVYKFEEEYLNKYELIYLQDFMKNLLRFYGSFEIIPTTLPYNYTEGNQLFFNEFQRVILETQSNAFTRDKLYDDIEIEITDPNKIPGLIPELYKLYNENFMLPYIKNVLEHLDDILKNYKKQETEDALEKLDIDIQNLVDEYDGAPLILPVRRLKTTTVMTKSEIEKKIETLQLARKSLINNINIYNNSVAEKTKIIRDTVGKDIKNLLLNFDDSPLKTQVLHRIYKLFSVDQSSPILLDIDFKKSIETTNQYELLVRTQIVYQFVRRLTEITNRLQTIRLKIIDLQKPLQKELDRTDEGLIRYKRALYIFTSLVQRIITNYAKIYTCKPIDLLSTIERFNDIVYLEDIYFENVVNYKVTVEITEKKTIEEELPMFITSLRNFKTKEYIPDEDESDRILLYPYTEPYDKEILQSLFKHIYGSFYNEGIKISVTYETTIKNILTVNNLEFSKIDDYISLRKYYLYYNSSSISKYELIKIPNIDLYIKFPYNLQISNEWIFPMSTCQTITELERYVTQRYIIMNILYRLSKLDVRQQPSEEELKGEKYKKKVVQEVKLEKMATGEITEIDKKIIEGIEESQKRAKEEKVQRLTIVEQDDRRLFIEFILGMLDFYDGYFNMKTHYSYRAVGNYMKIIYIYQWLFQKIDLAINVFKYKSTEEKKKKRRKKEEEEEEEKKEKVEFENPYIGRYEDPANVFALQRFIIMQFINYFSSIRLPSADRIIEELTNKIYTYGGNNPPEMTAVTEIRSLWVGRWISIKAFLDKGELELQQFINDLHRMSSMAKNSENYTSDNFFIPETYKYIKTVLNNNIAVVPNDPNEQLGKYDILKKPFPIEYTKTSNVFDDLYSDLQSGIKDIYNLFVDDGTNDGVYMSLLRYFLIMRHFDYKKKFVDIIPFIPPPLIPEDQSSIIQSIVELHKKYLQQQIPSEQLQNSLNTIIRVFKTTCVEQNRRMPTVFQHDAFLQLYYIRFIIKEQQEPIPKLPKGIIPFSVHSPQSMTTNPRIFNISTIALSKNQLILDNAIVEGRNLLGKLIYIKSENLFESKIKENSAIVEIVERLIEIQGLLVSTNQTIINDKIIALKRHKEEQRNIKMLLEDPRMFQYPQQMIVIENYIDFQQRNVVSYLRIRK